MPAPGKANRWATSCIHTLCGRAKAEHAASSEAMNYPTSHIHIMQKAGASQTPVSVFRWSCSRDFLYLAVQEDIAPGDEGCDGATVKLPAIER